MNSTIRATGYLLFRGFMRNNQGRLVLAFEADGERREFCRKQTHLSATARVLVFSSPIEVVGPCR